MPFIFVDDGQPEADDYDTNYVWVEPADVNARRNEARRRRACGRCPEPRPWWLLMGRGSRRACACAPDAGPSESQ